ncbi:hypothetical protein FP435_08045 [Lactobacillus sp. PV037]|uniref:SLAP domain-containing protein n=1 Tax=Lactobacillus sp. PV037 TaxID=2594496 RepID=UPI00223EAA12|nr:SLAP domain-containing protein [Lactobacillus sp. PV037]QNQ84370.1 hypothetical protein FP435_08045 [Lactobacillus sp. PV037]
MKKKLSLLLTLILLCSLLFPATTTSAASKHSLQLFFNSGAKVYDKNGHLLKTYNNREPHFSKGAKINYYGNVVYIKNKPYFYIGNGGYILAVNVAVLNNKTTLRLNHNSYVYDKNGKRIIHFNNDKQKTVLRYEIPINVPGKLKKATSQNPFYYVIKNNEKYYLPAKKIKGKYFYAIGHGGYVRAYNVATIDNNFNYPKYLSVPLVKREGITDSFPLFDKNQKLIKKRYPLSPKVKVNSIINEADRFYFRIQGTDTFIPGDYLKGSYKQMVTNYALRLPLYADLVSLKN